MSTDHSLTLLQMDCEAALSTALHSLETQLIQREILGNKESYVCASVLGSDIVIYIYEDEAQFHNGQGLVGLYESHDYATSESLQDAFVSGVCAGFGESGAANNSFKPKPLRGSA